MPARTKLNALGVLAAVLTIGCASTAPKVKPTMQAVAPASAVVVGKFGVLSRYKGRGLFYQLQAMRLSDQKKYDLPLSADDVGPDGTSVAFFLELPPGRYLLTKWLYQTPREQIEGKNAGLLFELTPGEVTCIGAIYMGSRGVIPTSAG